MSEPAVRQPVVTTSLSGLPTPTMDWHASDAPRALSKFKELCNLLFNGPLGDLSEERKVNYLLLWVGEEGRELANTWSLIEEDRKSLKPYWDEYEKFVKPKSNFRIARFKLRDMKQSDTESIDEFVKRIRIMIKDCNYPAGETNEHIIDTVIFGCKSDKIKSQLLQKDDKLTLDGALDIARTEEATRAQLKDLQDSTVHAVRVKSENQKLIKDKVPRAGTRQTYMKPVQGRHCNNCGNTHSSKRTDCPAYGTKCLKCGKPNHWKRMCRSNNSQRYSKKSVNSLETSPTTVETKNLYFDTVQVHSSTTDTQALLQIDIESSQRRCELRCKLDTGAEGNIMPLETYKTLVPNTMCNHEGVPVDLKPTNTKITAYGGSQITLYGTCDLVLHHQNKSDTAPFYVVKAPGPVIVGLPSCRNLELITFNTPVHEVSISRPRGDTAAKAAILSKYEDVFKGIGCFEGEYNIQVDPSVLPVVHPPRRVPEALETPLKEEIDSLVRQDILSKVDRPTDWVNSCVCVTKPNGRIRLCLDPKDLNKAVKRPHHYTKTLDDILPKLNGAKYFSILDARSGYWNIKLNEPSSLLTTFNTPFGRYKYNRLPFGIKLSQDVFQRKVDETFGEIRGCFGIADDLIVAGWRDDGADHDENLKAVLERARSTGVRFNEDKMVIRCKEIPFFGHIIGEEGIKPDPNRIRAIANLPKPTNIKDLQTILGMVNYLHRFTPKLSIISAPLRDLCKKDTVFVWGPEHDKAFADIKSEISKGTTLRYYNPKEPLALQVDASSRGLGTALIQSGGLIAYASKALTETECRYSNIEREMLAIVYGLERFHHYVYGRPVTVLSDHKPLESIVNKHLYNAPPRLARMLLRVQPYNCSVKYVPGHDVPLADTLSRIAPCKEGKIPGLDISVHELNAQLNASHARLKQIREETVKDSTLAVLAETISTGWPDKRSECPEVLYNYWNYRDELALEDGIILKGTRIVIPENLRKDVLKQIHYAHQGIDKCRLRAKGSVFWDKINADIELYVNKCPQCQAHKPSQVKEPLMPHDVPPRPWHTVASDLFYWEPKNYLLVVDMFSKFPVVRKLDNTSSAATIGHLRGIFEEHGIPEKMLSDNGPQYSSAEFKRFAEEYGFDHVTSSPRYPQSNGFAERMVQTIKQLFTKCHESGSDPHLAMLCLRTTPVDHSLPAPCELLNGRRYRSNIPSRATSRISDNDYVSTLQNRQDRSKELYNRHSRPLPKLTHGENVRIQDDRTGTWKPGMVKCTSYTPRSYDVTTSNGTYRRNQRHIRKTKETFNIPQDSVVDSGPPEIPEEPKEIVPPTTLPQEANSSALTNYVTRSGRTVVKPPRYRDTV